MPLEHLPIDTVTPFWNGQQAGLNHGVGGGDVAPAAWPVPPDSAMETLIESIRARGVLKPILVRPVAAEAREGGDAGEAHGPRYGIMPGNGLRRYHASQMAGLTRIPAFVLPSDVDDENEEGDEFEEATPPKPAVAAPVAQSVATEVEEAKRTPPLFSLAWAREARLLLQTSSYEEACATLGVAEAALHDALELLTLPGSVLRLLESGGDTGAMAAFTPDHARVLLRELPGDPRLQTRAAQKAHDDALTIAAFTELTQNIADAALDGDENGVTRLLSDASDAGKPGPGTGHAAALPSDAPPRTAPGWAARIESDSTALGLLLDERIAHHLAPEELAVLIAAAADAARRMELFVHKLRQAADGNLPPAPETRLACPLCGHAERPAASHCTLCWTPLRRCADCAHYDPAHGVCGTSGSPVTPTDARDPHGAAPSVCCGAYVRAFVPRALAEALVMAP